MKPLLKGSMASRETQKVYTSDNIFFLKMKILIVWQKNIVALSVEISAPIVHCCNIRCKVMGSKWTNIIDEESSASP